jgi:hypothetical protein
VSEIHDFTITRRHGRERGAQFYQDALSYAQSQWMSGKPAQAILQLDKAWMADQLPNARPAPYHALAWILVRATSEPCGFLGNPARHFQHLASRMSGPRSEIRAWRAWLCFHMARRVLPAAGFAPDGRQLARDGLWIPPLGRCLREVAAGGWPGEVDSAAGALRIHAPDFPP